MGHAVVAVWAAFRSEDDLDFADVVIELSSGVILRMPGFPDEDMKSVEIPPGARRVDASELPGVYGSRVRRLLRPRRDDEFHPGDAYLELQDGRYLWHTWCEPHGVGGAGLFVVDSHGLNDPIDLWDVPIAPLKD